jgi:hypothetical protein
MIDRKTQVELASLPTRQPWSGFTDRELLSLVDVAAREGDLTIQDIHAGRVQLPNPQHPDAIRINRRAELRTRLWFKPRSCNASRPIPSVACDCLDVALDESGDSVTKDEVERRARELHGANRKRTSAWVKKVGTERGV